MAKENKFLIVFSGNNADHMVKGNEEWITDTIREMLWQGQQEGAFSPDCDPEDGDTLGINVTVTHQKG